MSIVTCHTNGIGHGELRYSKDKTEDNTIPLGTVAVVVCDRGYIQHGSKKGTCVQNEIGFGRWQREGQETWKCKKACNRITVTFGSVTYSQDELPNGGYAKGAQYTISCYSGYRLNGAATRTCLDYGMWQTGSGSCHRSKAIFKLIYKLSPEMEEHSDLPRISLVLNWNFPPNHSQDLNLMWYIYIVYFSCVNYTISKQLQKISKFVYNR